MSIYSYLSVPYIYFVVFIMQDNPYKIYKNGSNIAGGNIGSTQIILCNNILSIVFILHLSI